MTFSVDKSFKVGLFLEGHKISQFIFVEWKTNQMGDFVKKCSAFWEYINFTVWDVLLSDTISNENILFSKKCVIVSDH